MKVLKFEKASPVKSWLHFRKSTLAGSHLNAMTVKKPSLEVTTLVYIRISYWRETVLGTAFESPSASSQTGLLSDSQLPRWPLMPWLLVFMSLYGPLHSTKIGLV